MAHWKGNQHTVPGVGISSAAGCSLGLGVLLLLANMAGCDRLRPGSQTPADDGAPSEKELKKISYMSTANAGPKGRKVYDRVQEAKSCHDFELAMRWNR